MSDESRMNEALAELKESGERFESCVIALAAADAGYSDVLRFIGAYRRMIVAGRVVTELMQEGAFKDLRAVERRADGGDPLEEVLAEAREIATVSHGAFRAHRKLSEERMKGKEPL